MTKRAAIIGNREHIQGFALLGIDIIPISEVSEARNQLFSMQRNSEYAVILVMENIMEKLSSEDEQRIMKSFTPAVIPVPSPSGETGYGSSRIRLLIERAIGSDIEKL